MTTELNCGRPQLQSTFDVETATVILSEYDFEERHTGTAVCTVGNNNNNNNNKTSIAP